jgi:prepilin-type N-terminal cleavage/methylation domain-containing protein
MGSDTDTCGSRTPAQIRRPVDVSKTVDAARRPRWRRNRPAFTIIEMVVCMVVASMVVAALYKVMTRQGRAYNQVIVSGDADESARSAGAILSFELRQASLAGGTLIGSLDAQSITVRSLQGIGIVCAKSTSDPRYAIWKGSGDIQATADDTAMIYSQSLKVWRKLKIGSVGAPDVYGMPSCDWAGARPPDLVVQVANFGTTDTTGILVGSPFRAYRQVQYGVFQANGRYWLGRKVSPSSGTYQILTGPLRGSTGLRFTYYNASGATTATASQVASVRFTVLTESYKQYRSTDGSLRYRYDSVTTRVALR